MELNKDAPAVVKQLFPAYEQIYAKKGWKMFDRIERVYVNDLARKELGWQPKYDFNYVLSCLLIQHDTISPLARQVGVKHYHPSKFKDGPYPV